MPKGSHNVKKYNDYPIPENQLTEIKSKIYATKYEAELKIYISQNFAKKGLNGLTKGLYKISSGNGYSRKYSNNEKAIMLSIISKLMNLEVLSLGLIIFWHYSTNTTTALMDFVMFQ